MARSASSFSRKPPKFKPQPTTLIVCEDKVSGKRYIEDVSRYFRSHTKVEVVHPDLTHPLGIVEYAISKASRFSKIYCVIDRDSHASFDSALRLASGNDKITVIASYPCFEIWLRAHFGYTRQPYERSGGKSPGENVVRDLKSRPLLADYEKKSTGVFEALLGQPFNTARDVSPRMLQDAMVTNAMNPCTEVHLLIDDLEDLGTPQLL